MASTIPATNIRRASVAFCVAMFAALAAACGESETGGSEEPSTSTPALDAILEGDADASTEVTVEEVADEGDVSVDAAVVDDPGSRGDASVEPGDAPMDSSSAVDGETPPDVAPADPEDDGQDPVDVEPVDCSDESQLELYKKRIEPLVTGEHPSSCNQCHLAGMDLSMYVKSTPCETMSCLVSQGLVDLQHPEMSEVLEQILKAEPGSGLITEEVITEEYDGFLEWISYSSACHEEVCGEQPGACSGEPVTEPGPAEGLPNPLGSCDEEAIVTSFNQTVFKWRGRCHGCHENCDPDYDAPCWLQYPEDKEDEASVYAGALASMYNVLGLQMVDVDEPFESLFLLKPADENKLGGVQHGGGAKFYDAADDAYQDYRIWLEHYAACFHGGEPQLPQVTIKNPDNKKKYLFGVQMTLIGSATDLQDGEIPEESLVWTSNLMDEPIGTGGGPFGVELPLGKHLLTLTATDSDGHENTRTIKVWVKSEL